MYCKKCTNSYYDTHKQTEIIVDAGPEVTDAILAQSPNNIIACASKVLNNVEKKILADRNRYTIVTKVEGWR